MRYGKFLWPLALLVWSCSEPEPIIAKCDMVDMVREGERVRLTIHSASESVEICPTWGECFRFSRYYFQCITMPYEAGEIYKVIDEGQECTIQL